jgi:TPP-dependent pyruvate/acetoin dehydrogenase alpha subunit
VPDVAERAASYDMPGTTVDGQDVIAVWEAAQTAVDRARGGRGPSLIECKTYRYLGHHQGDDPLRYRTEDEQQAARERDCLDRFRRLMERDGPLSADELDAIDERNRQLLDAAVEFAESSPVPPPDALYTDVYVPGGAG